MTRISVGMHYGADLTVVAAEHVARSGSLWKHVELNVIYAYRGKDTTDEARDRVLDLMAGDLKEAEVWKLAVIGPGSDGLWRVLRDDPAVTRQVRAEVPTLGLIESQVGRVIAAQADDRLFFAVGLDDEVVREVSRELAAARMRLTGTGRQRIVAEDETGGALHALAMAASYGLGEPRFRHPSGMLWDSRAEAQQWYGNVSMEPAAFRGTTKL